MSRTGSFQERYRSNSDGATGEAARPRGVLLVNIGTPASPDVPAVRRYLAEFLSDPMVIRLPRSMRWFQHSLGRLIAQWRGPRSAEKYRLIWTDRGSPLRAIMEDQAVALAERLPKGWRVFLGMRYGRPSISDTLREITSLGIEELVVVPLYPHFSQTTTGTVVHEMYRVLREEAMHINVSARTTWYDDAGYVNGQAHLIADYARSRGLCPNNVFLLISAHGLPVSYTRRGDPYARQVRRSVDLIVERLGWPAERHSLAFQSRMGPGEWLKPDLQTALKDLANKGERRVLVCPISFAVDCLDTLEEIHIRAREDFATLDGELFVCPALNTYGRFIDALKNLVIRGPQPVSSKPHTPLFATAVKDETPDSGLDTLVMIGAALPSRVGAGRGPRLVYSEPTALARAKKSHHEVMDFLESLRSEDYIREALIWNTCYRFECYAWLASEGSGSDQDCAVVRLRNELFDVKAPGLRVNTLFGADAWHHAMRTIAGLNSGLPGDKDVVEQFQTACRLAERAGMAGGHAHALVNEAISVAHSVREETSWGRLDLGYCFAAITRIQHAFPLKPANLRHVVIGGSTTSRSIIQTLYEQFSVKESAVTLVYRNHQGSQMKLLRKTVGHCRRLRTQSYAQRAVIEAIADADVVYFGIDCEEPVLSADSFRGLRRFDEHPLFVLDFNTSGSTEGLEALAGVQLWRAELIDTEVEAYAESTCAGEEFPRSVHEAEVWIADHTPRQIKMDLNPSCHLHRENGNAARARCGEVIEPATAKSET